MEQIWWERVPNARLYITDVVELLLKEKSVVLTCSEIFPWYSYMQSVIKGSVQQQNSSKYFQEVKNSDKPGEHLLKEFCKQEKRAAYRPTKSYEKFLAESDDIVLHERYLWVTISSKEQLESWMAFVSEYTKERGNGKEAAVFILEWNGQGSIAQKKGITIRSLDDYVSDYDRTVFCALAASVAKEREYLKNYMTELAVNVFGNDIELCAACLEKSKEFLKDPAEVISDIENCAYRSNGSRYCANKSKEEISKKIWLAQIKAVYPVLEEYREEFVQQYSEVIAKQLPITSSYGEEYNDPKEVELGTLKYMVDSGNLKLNGKERDRLNRYRDARNKLSHLTPLTLEEVEQLYE